ncbi:MAG TPA: hypothetical protein QF753_19305 [Victivallales bacterium]|nr:hypothetical protein [Victivallales bacterium]
MIIKTNNIPTFYQIFKEFIQLHFVPSKKKNNYKFEITEVKKTKSDLHELIVHVVGKGYFYNILAEELVNDDLLLKQFSQLDVRTICGYAFQDLNSPKYKLISSCFDFDENGLIKIKEKGKSKPIEKTLSDFVENDELVNNLTGKEALKIGYKKAEIDLQNHRTQLEMLRKEF